MSGRSLLTWTLFAVTLLISSDVAEGQRRGRRSRSSDFGVPQVKEINQRIRSTWSEEKLAPSPAATDGEWCRRVFLDVLGRIPTVRELNEFVAGREPDKRSSLLSKLLYEEAYVEEYARNWTTIWTNILIGRTGGTERNSLTNRSGLQKYLRDCFARDKPYNDMAFELVTATGSNTPGEAEFNGAVNFLCTKVNDEKATLATAATARIFLGLQVQCTQCHNHPFNDWKQQKFWELNAFFRQTSAKRQFVPETRQIQSTQLVNEDFAGEDTVPNPSKAAIYYELRNGRLKVAYPVFDGQAIDKSGRIQEVNRRLELGRFMLASEYLDKMIVNRYWAHFFGYGFTAPIDDMGPHKPPSHPELLDYLAQEIRGNSYSLKELIRWIALSEAYSLSSKITKSNARDAPQLGETPKFSHFYLRQMRAEELYESLLTATRVDQTAGSYESRERQKNQWLGQFVTAFGTDEGGEATTFNGTITQTLMMFNGELMRRATSAEPGSFLWEVFHRGLAPSEKVEYLFLAALSRSPTGDEVAMANQLYAARASEQLGSGPRRREIDIESAGLAALQDVWWAVLNSNEFILNH